MKDLAAYERIKFLHILQEVRGISKTRNHLHSILTGWLQGIAVGALRREAFLDTVKLWNRHPLN